MTVLCLTGWQQPADALSIIAPPDSIHASYATHDNVPSFLASLPKEVDLAIGWSLGGQLLVRAIAGKYVRAKKLLLLGAPFQFLASTEFTQGLPPELFGGVVQGYKQDPLPMLKQFCGLISTGDTNAASIARSLSSVIEVWKNGLFWLEELGRFSCGSLDFTDFPPTLLIQGDSDKVVYPAQAQLFLDALPGATLHTLKQCAHAPHMHDTAAIKQLVDAHV